MKRAAISCETRGHYREISGHFIAKRTAITREMKWPLRVKYAIIDGYPVFAPSTRGNVVDVEVYESDRLTSTRWAELDEFEGRSVYRRGLVSVLLKDGTHCVGTVYEGSTG